MHRRLYPGSDHGGLNSLLDRQKITDEELMILLRGRDSAISTTRTNPNSGKERCRSSGGLYI